MSNKKIAAYIRLSKEDEKDTESESITNQKELIKKYVEDNNLGECQYFIDDGYSGGNFERPQFKKLIKEIEKGNIRIVITKDTSRLGRDFIETSHYMFKYFPEHRIRYIAILENFDTANPNGVEDMIPFQTIINDWYLKDISKKIKSVRQNKMRQGLYMGSTVPYGYKRSKNNNCKFEIDEYSSKIVKKIFKMRLEGKTPTMIARKLSDEKINPPSIYYGKNINKSYTTYIWGFSTINQILQNEIYIGNLVQRKFDKVNYKSKKKVKLNKDEWIIVENFVEPIISKEEFKAVQEMKNKKIGSCQKKYDYILKGLVICGDCGKTMTVRRRIIKRKNKENSYDTYYCCSSNIRYRNGVCSLHYFQEQKLNKLVLERLSEILNKHSNREKMREVWNKRKNYESKQKEIKKEIAYYQNNKKTIELALKNLYLDKTNSIISNEEFIGLKAELEKDNKKNAEKIRELEEKIKQKNLDNIEQIIDKFINFQNPSKQILMELINKIEIMENKQVKVYLNSEG
ncbi:MAG: recombinase family protein [Clostridia bacterium]|nr:recombinase family protein [Clostridia bacterium]